MRPALGLVRRNGSLRVSFRGYYYRQNQNSHSFYSQSLLPQCSTSTNSRNVCDSNDEGEPQPQSHAHIYEKGIIGLNNTNDMNINNHNKYQIRTYVSATEPKSSSALIMGLGAIALTAKAGQLGIQSYNKWKEDQPPPDESTASRNTDNIKSEGKQEEDETTKKNSSKTQETRKSSEKRENIFAKLFNFNVGAKYYEGGFDDKMTRREAALILGVRESSTSKRIKDAHRKLLILNHPDTGGSTYLAGKLNEAKEMLLKGK